MILFGEMGFFFFSLRSIRRSGDGSSGPSPYAFVPTHSPKDTSKEGEKGSRIFHISSTIIGILYTLGHLIVSVIILIFPARKLVSRAT